MMTIDQATPPGETEAVALNKTWLLGGSNSGDGLRFQHSFLITLPTGGLAEELLIDDTTSFALRAHHWVFNARDSDSPEQTQIEQFGSGLRVSLPVPRLIHSIRFANNISPDGKTTQLFRTDADIITDEPVASYFNRPTASIEAMPLFNMDENMVAEELLALTSNELTTTLKAVNLNQPSDLPPGELGVVDGRILVRLKDSSFVPLNSNAITEFNLATGPENLRVGVRLPTLGSDIFFLPLSFDINQRTDAGTALREQISTLLQRLRDQLAGLATNAGPPLLPASLEIELVIESDAPCQFTLDQFAIRYRLARHSLPGGKPKQVLRFPDAKLAHQHLGFYIPSPITLTHATLRLAGTDPAQQTADTPSASSGQLNNLLKLPDDNGLQLNTTHRWASPLTLNDPILSNGCDLLVSVLSPNTQLYLKIVADNNGTPTGEHLATAFATVPFPHRAQLLRFSLDAPLLLQPGVYWLMVESRDGTAIWRLQPHADARIIPWGENADRDSAVVGQAGVASWIAAEGPTAAAQQLPEITLSGQPLPISRDGNDWVYDMSASLGTAISGSGLLSAELSMLTSGPKSLTVYPPRFEYDLQDPTD